MGRGFWLLVPKKDREKWALPLSTYEKDVSSTTVLRLAVKAFAGEEFIDLRLWGRSKSDKLYPKRNGICMRLSLWETALKLFSDNNVLRVRAIDEPSLSTPNKPLEIQE